MPQSVGRVALKAQTADARPAHPTISSAMNAAPTPPVLANAAQRGSHWQQRIVTQPERQWVSFSSACRLFFRSLLRLPFLRLTWRCRQAAPTFERRDSFRGAPFVVEGGDAAKTFFDFRVQAASREAVIIFRQTGALGFEGGYCFVGGFDFDLNFCLSFHFSLSFLSGALPLRWLKINPTAWVMQYKSSTIFRREIANEIRLCNADIRHAGPGRAD
jgi:hypothetical protein